jgi:hypothetical protein
MERIFDSGGKCGVFVIKCELTERQATEWHDSEEELGFGLPTCGSICNTKSVGKVEEYLLSRFMFESDGDVWFNLDIFSVSVPEGPISDFGVDFSPQSFELDSFVELFGNVLPINLPICWFC